MRNLTTILASIAFIFLFINDASARKILINEYVTTVDGCEYHITGWIDVSVNFGWPPIKVNGYDIQMNGPCGDHHFQGMVTVPDREGRLIFFNSHLYKKTNENEYIEIPLDGFPHLNPILIELYREYS